VTGHRRAMSFTELQLDDEITVVGEQTHRLRVDDFDGPARIPRVTVIACNGEAVEGWPQWRLMGTHLMASPVGGESIEDEFVRDQLCIASTGWRAYVLYLFAKSTPPCSGGGALPMTRYAVSRHGDITFGDSE
jgi:hypothetical protein